MNDSYKIIISISHHRISFEYYLKGGGDDLKPVPPGNWPAPLAFMVTPTEVFVGQEAENAANRGVENTFTNYFDLLIQDNIYYTLGNERRNIGKILLDASEPMFRVFYKSVLFNHYGDLHDNRLQMPLTIVCEADVKDNERVYIKSLFNDSGYHMSRVVKYEDYIAKYVSESLRKNYPCQKVLVVWSEGDDLCLSLFDCMGNQKPTTKVYPRLGTDPRMDLVKKLIWERVHGQNYYLDYACEEATINKAAAEFLNSSNPLLNGIIQLSDGISYRYSLLRSDIDAFECEESQALRRAIEDFLNENAQDDKSKVLVILRGVAAGNPYFESNIGRGYSNVIRSDKDLREAVMTLIVNDQITAKESIESTMPPHSTPTLAQDVPDREVSPSGRDKRDYKELAISVVTHISNKKFSNALDAIDKFLESMHSKSIHFFDNDASRLRDDIIKKQKEETPDTQQQQISVEPSGLDKRAFKMAKADAECAYKNGDIDKALKILKTFKTDMMAKGIICFNNEIDTLFSNYNKKTLKTRPSKTQTPTNPPENKKEDSKEPSPRDQRDFRILKKQIESKLSQKDKLGAQKELKIFVSNMHSKGIRAFDKDIKILQEQINLMKNK